ncbi:MAG: 1-acyl-sn-glycerol-3-phosphate acyltransferase [Planctomycetes bacterium ADurb.Bin126]|nr:MAG: 1-acyl-sn-glycerol-3-phosphate acyltransferase [Planctomycetes bacterium ADurb.Bin126]HOD83482.1 lysophospholipid acyltransferase family protein [Phycisphaerae bacterium]HQL75388.1 lysophospholipid acyltransferase family protein [Phycisphaerae bacterium]
MTVRALRSLPNPSLEYLRWPWARGRDVPGPGLYYRVWRRLFQVTMTSLWRIRVFNRDLEPLTGGTVYVCNHQSFLDPMLMSFALRRPMSYMARDSLFRFAPFKKSIELLNAFPVRRGTADLGALKEAMRRIKAGGQVVVFAEGTRTPDGHIQPFLPGVAMLSQRAAEWTVPVVIDGAYEVWPRTQPLPSPGGSISVQYAPPIHRDQARRDKPEQFVDRVRDILIDMQTDLRRRVGRPALRYEK